MKFRAITVVLALLVLAPLLSAAAFRDGATADVVAWNR